VIGIFLEEIGNRVGRQVEGLGLGRPNRQGAGFGHQPIAVIELENGPRRRRIGLGQVADFEIGHVAVGKDIVAKGFHEVAEQPALVAVDQLTRLDAEIARDRKQQRHRHLAPVVLDQVQVAGRDTQRRGEVGLRQLAQASQALDAAADLHFRSVAHRLLLAAS
jgi:hypothetical protein